LLIYADDKVVKADSVIEIRLVSIVNYDA
jgi:hypothetical protein